MKFRMYFSISVCLLILIFSNLSLYNFSLAQTPNESLILQLREQIISLQEQVAKLQSEVSSTKTELEAVKTELKFTKTLRLGTKGNEVKQLQEFLKQFPDIYPQGLITGYFGPLTEIAVKKFQDKQGIESIGVIGPKTLSKLNELITEGAGSSSIIPPGLTVSTNSPQVSPGQATTTISIAPALPISAQPAIAVPTGVCLIKDRFTDIPRFDITNFGNGFAKYVINGINTVAGLQTACTKTIYDYLLQNYCKASGNSIQRLIVTYDDRGIAEAKNLNCSSLGCDFISCSTVTYLAPIQIPTTTPSGTITAIPANPATPATSTSVSNIPTVSATPATPAVPATTTPPTTTTPPATTTDTTPLIISSVNAYNITKTGATIEWFTDKIVSADSYVEYGTTSSYGAEITYNTLATYHQVILPNTLNSGTVYHYRVKSKNAAGNLTVSPDYTFTTLAATADTTPPVISNVHAENITTSGAQIKWTTDEPADSIVGWGTSSSNLPATSVSCSQNSSRYVTDHCIDLSVVHLSPGTTYYYKVRSDDQANNFSESVVQQFTTTATVSTATSTSSLNSRSQNLSAISQMLNSLDEVIKQLSKILK